MDHPKLERVGSVQAWTCPTQAKIGLEWGTRPALTRWAALCRRFAAVVGWVRVAGPERVYVRTRLVATTDRLKNLIENQLDSS